jgi:hypothetical protein
MQTAAIVRKFTYNRKNVSFLKNNKFYVPMTNTGYDYRIKATRDQGNKLSTVLF